MSSVSPWLTEDQVRKLADCRQGDVVSWKEWAWFAHGDLPTTALAKNHVTPGEPGLLRATAPDGQVVLTQTCDLMPREGRDRPFVAIAPLVRLSDEELRQASKGHMPRYAHVPAHDDGTLFADLDRITTIETGLLLTADRQPGLSTDDERNAFARAVARKFQRFAFPDELPPSLAPWRRHVIKKHEKTASAEGALYRQAIEVRAAASPSWEAEEISVEVTVLFPPGFLPAPDESEPPTVSDVQEIGKLDSAEIAQGLLDGSDHGLLLCDRLEALWSDRCKPSGRISSIDFRLAGTDDMTAEEYLGSFSLDLEFLSSAEA